MKQAQLVYLLFILFFFSACKKEEESFAAISELNVTVINELDVPVSGVNVSIYDNQALYELAVANRNYSQAIISANTDNQGKIKVELEPEKPYFILATYFDNTRQQNLNNVGISGAINPLPARTNIFINLKIKAADANIIFYTTQSNKLPIDINIKESRYQLNKNFILNSIFTQNRLPTVLDTNNALVLRDPGSYTYYAKSADGCAWQGKININKGDVATVNFDKCPAGSVSFYTTSVNDTLLPLNVVLNNIDTVGNITSSRPNLTCSDDKSNTLTFVRDAGLYTYQVKSKSGRCIWTGSLAIKQDSCHIVPISICE